MTSTPVVRARFRDFTITTRHPIVDLTAVPRHRSSMHMFGLFYKYNLEDTIEVPAGWVFTYRGYRPLRPVDKHRTCLVLRLVPFERKKTVTEDRDEGRPCPTWKVPAP